MLALYFVEIFLPFYFYCRPLLINFSFILVAAMADNALEQKLNARRKAMDSAVASKRSLNAEDSSYVMDDQEMTEVIPTEEESDKEGEEMKSALEQRREKSKRILDQQEEDESKVQPSTKSQLTRVCFDK